MVAWPKTLFLRPPATLALTLNPLGVSRDFFWNETRSLFFSQGLRFKLSSLNNNTLILGPSREPFLLFALTTADYINRQSL